MCFSHLAGENRHYYWPYMSMGHSFQILMDYIFPLASSDFFHTYVLINFQPNTIGVFSKYLYGSHSVQLSPLWYSVLWTLVALFSLDFQLHFLTSGIPRVLHLVYPALHRSLETQADNLGQITVLSWFVFPSVLDHFPSLFDSQCFETYCFIHFVYFVYFCFRREDKSGPCHSILVRSRPHHYLNLT